MVSGEGKEARREKNSISYWANALHHQDQAGFCPCEKDAVVARKWCQLCCCPRHTCQCVDSQHEQAPPRGGTIGISIHIQLHAGYLRRVSSQRPGQNNARNETITSTHSLPSSQATSPAPNSRPPHGRRLLAGLLASSCRWPLSAVLFLGPTTSPP